MRKTPWTDVHDRLLVHATSPPPESSDAELDRVWNRVVAAMESSGDRGIPFPDLASRQFAVKDQVRDARCRVPSWSRSAPSGLGWPSRALLVGQPMGRRDPKRRPTRPCEAIGMILDAPVWPAVVAVDPEPYSRTETRRPETARARRAPSGIGTRASSITWPSWVRPCRDAIRTPSRAPQHGRESRPDSGRSGRLRPDSSLNSRSQPATRPEVRPATRDGPPGRRSSPGLRPARQLRSSVLRGGVPRSFVRG